MESTWAEVLEEALASAGKKAIPAAKLRTSMERIARTKKLQFPPAEMAGRKFSDFLADFPEVIALRKRQGQDYLVAPANEPQLLAESASLEVRQGRLRQDLFHALTRTKPDGKTAFYLPEIDTVVWEAPENAPPGAVAFPSVEPEATHRQAFAEQMDEPAKSALQATVDRQPAFLSAIHERALAKKWHHFRLNLLIARLRAWTDGHGFAWGPNWIEGAAAEGRTLASVATTTHGNSLQIAFSALSSSLSDEDLKRISVPLDLVLKVLSARG